MVLFLLKEENHPRLRQKNRTFVRGPLSAAIIMARGSHRATPHEPPTCPTEKQMHFTLVQPIGIGRTSVASVEVLVTQSMSWDDVLEALGYHRTISCHFFPPKIRRIPCSLSSFKKVGIIKGMTATPL